MQSPRDDDILVALGTKISQRTRRRLDALKDAGHAVNISETCEKALNNACDRLEIERGLTGTEVVAARLCDAIHLGTHREDSNLGFLAGQRWARLHAHPLELAIIACEIEPMLADGSYCFEPESPWPPYAMYYDIKLINYHNAPVERAIAFWTAMIGDPLAEISTTFAWSFISGAAYVWRETLPQFYNETCNIDLNLYGFTVRECPPSETEVGAMNSYTTELRTKPPRNARRQPEEVPQNDPESTPKKPRKQRD